VDVAERIIVARTVFREPTTLPSAGGIWSGRGLGSGLRPGERATRADGNGSGTRR
jgi:hypothetical protein